ncbi:MAG: hypothetical protein J6Q85_07720 [Clostridia bacterium]|nr:hypothetical protein [Clostridia bacterium]
MGNRKGQKHYPESIKQKIVEEHKSGAGLRWLERKYGIADIQFRVCVDCDPR